MELGACLSTTGMTGVVGGLVPEKYPVDVSIQNLQAAVGTARDRAKEILSQLEGVGHPQTNQSSSLYLALVSIQKRLKAETPNLPQIRAELEQLVTLCDGKLAAVRPLLEEAVRNAR